MAYGFDQIFAADPANPANIAQNASVTIFAPGDGTMTPIAITDPDGQALPNPITVNANGFGSAFMADIDRVAWLGGGFTGFFTSYDGMKNEAVAARAAAETAASTAGADAAAIATAAIGTATADANAAAASAATAASNASASATAAANSAALVGAPADTAIAAAINGTGATKTALNATILTEVAAPISAATAPKMDKHQVKLRRWYARLGWRESAPARILACGDSITEGTGAGTITRRWQTLLQTRLRAATYQNFGAVFPFIPANPATTTTGHPIVRTGTWTAISKGLAYRGVSLGTDGKVTFTFTGTRAKVQFVSLVDAASVGGVKVDAGSIVPVTIAMTASGETAVMYDTGTLTAGVHTVEVTRDATSTTNPVLSGLATWDGDEGKGIQVIDSAKSGTTASVFANAGLARLQARCAMAIGSYGLAVLGYGTNDFSQGQTAAQFKANTNILIGELRSNGFTGSIILMLPYLGQDRDATAWDAYGAALKEIADGDPDILFFDLTEKMPDVPNPYNSTAAMSLYADTLHPADAGHGYIADMLLSLIMPR